jgi:chemotaxis protein MotB
MHNRALDSARADLQEQVVQLEGRLESSQEYSLLQLIEKEKQLANKEAELQKREARLQELESIVTDQQLALQSLKDEVCSALKCFTPEELSISIKEGKLYVSMSNKLLFESGSDQVNERGAEALAMIAAALDNSDLEILIEGHTDNVPIKTDQYEDNWDLSAHRATSVSRILIENDIEPSRIMACGRAEYKPIASNETEEGRQHNRRTEIVLFPKLDKLWKLADDRAPATALNQNSK